MAQNNVPSVSFKNFRNRWAAAPPSPQKVQNRRADFNYPLGLSGNGEKRRSQRFRGLDQRQKSATGRDKESANRTQVGAWPPEALREPSEARLRPGSPPGTGSVLAVLLSGCADARGRGEQVFAGGS